MSEQINVFDSFRQDGTDAAFGPGDVALVLKANGTVAAINFNYDMSRLDLPEDLKTDLDNIMVLQGQKLFALALAATNEQVMDLLLNIAADPNIVDFSRLADMKRTH